MLIYFFNSDKALGQAFLTNLLLLTQTQFRKNVLPDLQLNLSLFLF
jgi:hypothetical protein